MAVRLSLQPTGLRSGFSSAVVCRSHQPSSFSSCWRQQRLRRSCLFSTENLKPSSAASPLSTALVPVEDAERISEDVCKLLRVYSTAALKSEYDREINGELAGLTAALQQAKDDRARSSALGRLASSYHTNGNEPKCL